jgi:hypothetical protein
MRAIPSVRTAPVRHAELTSADLTRSREYTETEPTTVVTTAMRIVRVFQRFDMPIRIVNRVDCQSRATSQVKVDQPWQRRQLCGSCLGELRVLGPEAFEPRDARRTGIVIDYVCWEWPISGFWRIPVLRQSIFGFPVRQPGKNGTNIVRRVLRGKSECSHCDTSLT